MKSATRTVLAELREALDALKGTRCPPLSTRFLADGGRWNARSASNIREPTENNCFLTRTRHG